MPSQHMAREKHSLTTSVFPSEILEKAPSRFTALSILFVCSTVLMDLLFRFVYPGLATPLTDFIIYGSIAVSITAAVVFRSGLLAPTTLLRAGVLYTILTSFGLGMLQFCGPMGATERSPGASWVAMWIAVCGLSVPNTLSTSVTMNFAAAASHPIAYWLSRQITDYAPLPPGPLALMIVPTFLIAFWTTVLNQRMYRMAKEVAEARQMGSYRLDTLIAKGGMGEIWRGSHSMLARDAAVKLIRPEMLLSHTSRQASLVRKRFEQEARSTAVLRSPNTVELYDFGVAADGSFYYVMELLDGLDLEKLVQTHGPQAAGRVIYIVKQVCRSLAEAHQLGLVHRDIKPTNIFLTRLGLECDFVKVLDFGLVKRELAGEDSGMTVQGTTAGTPAFMAPEIARADAHIDGRADLYALGCVAYWLLTGTLVFPEKGSVAVIMAHLQKTPPSPSSRTELPIPSDLEKIVLACLEKSPAQRPQSAEELIGMLDRCEATCGWDGARAADWWSMHAPARTSKAHLTAAASTATV